MIPVPVSFAGMPNTRWWSFEERKTNFGDIDASTTDLAKLLFLEFALVYANDWFVIPYTLPAGAIAAIRGVAVTNTFGERFWIEAAGSGADADWQRWSMFTINVRRPAGAPADTSLLLLPTVAKLEQGPTDRRRAADPRRGGEHGLGRREHRCRSPSGETKRRGSRRRARLRAFYEAQLRPAWRTAAARRRPPTPRSVTR